jgi:hypothetical protein
MRADQAADDRTDRSGDDRGRRADGQADRAAGRRAFEHAFRCFLGAWRLQVIAADRRHVVLARLVDEEAADAVLIETGADKFAARPFDFVLSLKMTCNNCRHAVLLLH